MQTTEEATPAAEQNGVADGEKTTEAAQPTTNGVSDEKKIDDVVAEATPIVAAAVEAVAAPVAAVIDAVSTEISKPIEEIKQVAEETVEEAIVAASKSVDEKINVAVAKPEVNAVNDLHREPIETSVTNEQSSEKAIVDQISDSADTSVVGLGDCTNNTNNNNPLPNPPPLPECPPPSQVSVFAETAMSSAIEVEAIALPAPELPQSIPIIETHVIPSDSASVSGSAKIELIDNEQPIAAAQDIDRKVVVEEVEEEKEESNVNETVSIVVVDNIEPQLDQASLEQADSLPKPEEIAETIAILDSVNDAEIKAPEEITDISVDISSPLPQNSLDSLPSPQSLSNVSPPSEIEENTTTELANEDASLVLPPPPPPAVDDEVADELSVVTETPVEPVSVTESASAEIEISNGDDLPPPPPPAVNEEESESINVVDVHASATVNGNGESNTNGDSEILDALATNGCHVNGDSKTDGAVIIDKVINPTFE